MISRRYNRNSRNSKKTVIFPLYLRFLREKNIITMKKIAFFIIALAISLSVNAQSYENLWKEYDENIGNILPESAGKVLDKIEKQARKDKNDIQLLKIIIKRCDILRMTAENPEDSIVGYCKSYLPKLSKASQVILNVEIAKHTDVYDDILAYKDNDFIKTVSMNDYAELFMSENEHAVFDINLEPTLYDYVMHCLLAYYKYFSVEKELYDKLLDFDLRNNYIKAYYNNRIEQIGSIFSQEDFEKYNQLAAECIDNECLAKIKIQQIKYLTNVDKDKFTEKHPYVKAKELCDEAMKLLDKKHPLYQQCVEFINSLTKRNVRIQINNVCVPNQPIAVGLTYRNTINPSYRIIKVSANEFRTFKNYDDEDLYKQLMSKKAIVENTVNATVETDYDGHSSLIALPALQNGQYYLVFSDNNSFKNIDDLVFTPFQVSELSYFSLKTDDNMHFYVLNRETGQPIDNVKANFLKREYNYKTKENDYISLGEVVSDKNGFLVAPFDHMSNSFLVDLCNENDTLLTNNQEIFSNNNSADKEFIRTHIFIDRAIYRPGQTVQFKGVVIREIRKQYEIIPDYDVVMSFYDPMFQLIDTLRVKSDEFGAFSGSFVIPTDRMRGNYHISANHSNGTSFKVENYKRPTFEVTFETPVQEYKIGDSVTVSGKIAALSGFGLDNVQYRYVVTRKTMFPYRFWGWSPYHVSDETVATNEGITSVDGTFSIGFRLSPSKDVELKHIPKYTYEIKVEATNKQGETQSGTYSISATYNNYVINVENMTVNVTNINGNPVSAKLECKIFKFNDIDRYERDLGDFDRQLLSEQLLKAYFPNFDYYAKQNITKDIVYQKVMDVDGTARLLSKNEKLKPGKYLIELKSVDDSLSFFSDEYIVFDEKAKKMPYKSMCWTKIDKKSALPGETINYYVGSSERNVSALVIVKRGKTIIKSERVTLNNNVYKLSYKVREEDRGQLDFQMAFEKFNTENRHVDYVDVPYNNKDLDITLNTERNKMLPGETETWSVTVKDYKNKPAVTSLMAVMYDASLDKFAKNTWALRVKPKQYPCSTIMSDNSFSTLTNYKPFNIANFYIGESLLFSNYALIDNYRSYGKNMLAADESNVYYCLDSAIRRKTDDEETQPNAQTSPAKIRKDFNETAFFYPDLRTDKNGNATFTFTMPDAMTRWNLMMLAFNKDLSVGYFEKNIVTQQPLMIMADMPRFAYDEDTLWIAANVINLSDEALSPTAKLEIFDENNNQIELILSDRNINISEIPAYQSQSVRWKMAMQKDVNPLTFRFSAMTDGFSDAEQHLLPVLSTDIFMTQTYSLTVDANTLKEYEININNESERNHDIKLDFKANPVFYVIQTLPYIAEGDEKYAMTAFNRYFVNKMAQQIVESNPNIEEMLEGHEADTLSELQKNEEVKALLLKETPWVLDAKNEAQQRANVSKLFDTEAIAENIASAFEKLAKKQTVNGGWPWIDGMPESEFITQYVLSGLGRLGDNSDMTEKAFHFIENEVVVRYNKLDTKKKKDNAACDFMTMKDLFAMSYFSYETSDKFNEAKAFFIKKLFNDWKQYGVESQSYIALILNRNNHIEVANLIIKSLRERAIKNEQGMYWRNINLETESRILEAFNEIDPKNDETDNMRLWILSQKRTNMWENDRATVEAIFAIMNRGTDWTAEDAKASMIVDDDSVKVFVDNQSNHVIWGGLYRQYFVPIDKVQKHNDAMKITREIIMPENVKVGDKVTINITFENSQDMEFVYLKDLRGACFEPTEQISRYHWDSGLWYYQSTTDVSMEYFFEYLPKGKHTVSYEMYVTKDGSFSAGYSYIQCQYAPEFGAYSNGSRISVNP